MGGKERVYPQRQAEFEIPLAWFYDIVIIQELQ